jgi:hypothetical protein
MKVSVLLRSPRWQEPSDAASVYRVRLLVLVALALGVTASAGVAAASQALSFPLLLIALLALVGVWMARRSRSRGRPLGSVVDRDPSFSVDSVLWDPSRAVGATSSAPAEPVDVSREIGEVRLQLRRTVAGELVIRLDSAQATAERSGHLVRVRDLEESAHDAVFIVPLLRRSGEGGAWGELLIGRARHITAVRVDREPTSVGEQLAQVVQDSAGVALTDPATRQALESWA